MKLLALFLLAGTITNTTPTKIEWVGEKDLYRVEHSTNLVEGAWTTHVYTTTNVCAVIPNGFYRVIVQELPPPPLP